ncbi:hypothetical protein KUCAC02_030760, partial [Chaenocephalus aceratus]
PDGLCKTPMRLDMYFPMKSDWDMHPGRTPGDTRPQWEGSRQTELAGASAENEQQSQGSDGSLGSVTQCAVREGHTAGPRTQTTPVLWENRTEHAQQSGFTSSHECLDLVTGTCWWRQKASALALIRPWLRASAVLVFLLLQIKHPERDLSWKRFVFTGSVVTPAERQEGGEGMVEGWREAGVTGRMGGCRVPAPLGSHIQPISGEPENLGSILKLEGPADSCCASWVESKRLSGGLESSFNVLIALQMLSVVFTQLSPNINSPRTILKVNARLCSFIQAFRSLTADYLIWRGSEVYTADSGSEGCCLRTTQGKNQQTPEVMWLRVERRRGGHLSLTQNRIAGDVH